MIDGCGKPVAYGALPTLCYLITSGPAEAVRPGPDEMKSASAGPVYIRNYTSYMQMYYFDSTSHTRTPRICYSMSLVQAFSNPNENCSLRNKLYIRVPMQN